MIKFFFKIAKNELFNICRSLTGPGNKKTLKILKDKIPEIKIISFKSNKKVFDWKIPHEWIIKDAYVLDKFKKKIIDFKVNNLHLVGYSKPINKFIKKKEFLDHLHSLSNQPKAIPYVTSYYKKYWGFCVTEKFKQEIKKNYKINDVFKVVIKSKFNKMGSLKIGEVLIPGKSKQEILLSTYICHPSMANDNLSGVILLCSLIKYFQKIKNLKKTIRFIFLPETIGSIAYLCKNYNILKKNVIGGFNFSCVGDEKNHSYMLSKYQNSPADFALEEAYKKLKINAKKYSFLERGSDERQYNSPGIDLPIASIFRSKYGTFQEYHTSLDDFKFVTLKGLYGSFEVAKKSIKILLNKDIPKSNILCEPHLSKRNLYPSISKKRKKNFGRELNDFLQYADGKNDLLNISKLINSSYKKTKKFHKILLKHKLISN